MKCIKCGADNGDGNVFCKNCGEKLETGTDTVVQPMTKRGKRRLIISIAAVVIVAAIAVIFFTVVLPSDSNASLVCGNTPMNIQNGGIAAESNGWIYYCNSGDNRTLYKIRTDGTGKTKLNDDYSLCINVIGDWVYYIHPSAEAGSICSMRTDGTGGEIIYEGEQVIRMLIYGDWMYYIALSQGDPYMCRMRTDGTEKTAYDGMPVSFTIEGGWIYYLDSSDFKNYKMRLNGSEKTELGGGKYITYITLADGWIYFNNNLDLSKVRADGTELKKLTDDGALEINAADGWVYYTNLIDRCIYKIRTDGTEKTKLNDDGGTLNIAGDWVYYAEKGQFYRMKTDGSENQPVE